MSQSTPCAGLPPPVIPSVLWAATKQTAWMGSPKQAPALAVLSLGSSVDPCLQSLLYLCFTNFFVYTFLPCLLTLCLPRL